MKKLHGRFSAGSWAWSAAAITAVLASACGGGGGGGDSTGTLGVSLTDAPACGFDAVNVTVLKVRVHQSSTASDTDAGWYEIPVNRKINLLNLSNGVLDKLGEVPLAAGHYTQVRLVLDANSTLALSNSVVPTGGSETALVTPSAVQSGIKLVNEFDVAAGQRVDLVLDFDACKSIVQRGNGTYALKPVIKVVPFVLNGIDGYVDLSLLGSKPMVTAQQNGVIVQSSVPNPLTGEFFLPRLPIGNYDVVFTANGRATAVIATVPVVSATSVAIVSSSVAPVALPVSATHIASGKAVLNPTSAVEIAYVAGKQTVGATAPVVTVRFIGADDTAAGAYSLVLPTAAPLLGQFGTGALPIGLVVQAGAAGKYSIEASAVGYKSQSVSKDLTSLDVTQDFTLVP